MSSKGSDYNDAATGYPGAQLGLPQTGPGSLASWGRRILALFIDWGIASLISLAWFEYDVWVTLGIFVLFHVVLVGLLGVSLGKRLVRIQVVRLHRDRPASVPGPLWALVRVILLLLVVPAVVVSPDGRALHDKITGTVQVVM
ncbi:RDD family protein [Nesterenkonia haasae]|uniref:RDD family protein n=1 Tax=Nesterenkonia haasae TaxID=2587813 RepID=UPI001390FA10|nr:RDD family protein [Nesterenkonia haasae]NDK30544.1 RDD family protein [Nesterenkonia haasae]